MAAPTTCPAALRARIRRCRASLLAPFDNSGRNSMRVVGMDIHRSFAQVATALLSSG